MSSTDADVDAWATQLGPALSEADVALLLGRELEDVAGAPELLRLHQCDDGESVYPVWQFERGRGLVPGVAEVLAVLTSVLEPLMVASWLTSRNRELEARPIDVLRADGPDVNRVLTLASRLASSAR